MSFPGTPYELQECGRFIATVVAAVDDVEVRQQLEPLLEEMVKDGKGNLVVATRRLLEGERDVDVLWESLDWRDAPIIYAILWSIADSETLQPLLEGQE